jgi:predicted amidohydrolase/GNAT superfamily N-acetyltransferase
MQLWTFESPQGPVQLRHARPGDESALIALNRLCFPQMAEQNVVWRKSQLESHARLFPEGQIVAELDGEIVGAVASLIVNMGADPYRAHTYAGVTDGGYFYNHDPTGDSLYGADVYVHPRLHNCGIGRQLYEARRQLCRSLNLRRIIAGGRIVGYGAHAAEMTAEQYVKKVERGELRDQVLGFQLREGFIVRGILRSYITDPKSKNCATFIEWKNPDYTPKAHQGERKLRVAAVQYQVRKIEKFEDFAAQVEYFIETAAEYRADFVLFPEFFSVQLLSQPELSKLPSLEGIQRLAQLEEQYLALMSGLAQRFGLYIIGGTHPMRREARTLNMSPFFFPDGSHVLQPKLHITPSERRFWGITGGDDVMVISTPKAKVGINICYDVEFPEFARYLADQGVEILFVPYCTDDRQGYYRVRYCCQARAIENQIYVVTAGIIGNLPSVPAMDIHYGRAAVFTPSDFQFARDGIQAEADSNVETLLVTDLDIDDLYRARAAGSVTPRLDRRKDLFEFRHNLSGGREADPEDAPLVAVDDEPVEAG